MPPPVFGDGAAGAASGTSGAVAPPSSSPTWSFPPSPAAATHIDSATGPYAGGVLNAGRQQNAAHLGSLGSDQAAFAGGVWQTDSSQMHAASLRHVKVPARPSLAGGGAGPDGRRTFRVCYLFSGVQRRASIAESLKKLCDAANVNLIVEEVDILVGGAAHNLLDSEAQES